jgi:amino acid transporter
MQNFFLPSYWFTMQPPEINGWLGTVVFIAFLVIFVVGIAGRVVTDRKNIERLMKIIGGRISTMLIVMGALGLILYFFSFERIQLFGARFWYPIWIVAVVVWAAVLFRFVKRDVPRMREMSALGRERAKYLPGRK